MLNISYIGSPSNNVSDQTIESIDVIEAWNLEHNLSNVIKCIERVSHNSQNLKYLKKAEWHLDRACSKAKNGHLEMLNNQQVQIESDKYPPQAICEDWKLTDLMCSTLINIYFSRQHQSHVLKQKALLAALECLREEIRFLDKDNP
ncbi:MAG: DUF3310 domain-containing protein [Alphaproteobacteria bacterium]|jgi:hypothetical protein|nr:DUF3310 domain-containing protein [Alphaproteobacteria bacterium]